MADPITIIGTAGAIANVIEVVSRTISALRELQGRWKQADLAFLSLVSQLTALRAALGKIQLWSDDLEIDPDYQLVMDLDISISCCRLLVSKFDSFFFELNKEAGKPFDFASKVKFVFGTKDLEGIQKMIGTQVSTLTLLLTTCNCETLSDQRRLLQASNTRKAIRDVELDAASLFVHRDSSSIITGLTDNLSRLSVRFDFDRELFITKVYEKVFRSSMKDSIRQHRKEPMRKSSESAVPRKARETSYKDDQGQNILREYDRIWYSKAIPETGERSWKS